MTTATQKLKSGGKTKKKGFGDGGEPDVEKQAYFDRMIAEGKMTPEDATKAKQGLISGGIGMAGDLISTGIESLAPETSDDWRVDPSIAQAKQDKVGVASSVAKATAKGAAMGSTIPVIGTLIGGAAGLVTGLASAAFGSKKRQAEREKQKEEWGGRMVSGIQKGRETTSYKSGGKIVGKGGPKSDSIDMKAEDGSFIVPAENKEIALQLGKDYLGWKGDEMAKRNYATGGEIKVSDGEVMFTPEETSILKYHGVDLNKLAPNAKPGNKAADGKLVGEYDKWSVNYKMKNPDATDADAPGGAARIVDAAMAMGDGIVGLDPAKTKWEWQSIVNGAVAESGICEDGEPAYLDHWAEYIVLRQL